jgi:hypothetical protein
MARGYERPLLQVASAERRQPGGRSNKMIRMKDDPARHARGQALPAPE